MRVISLALFAVLALKVPPATGAERHPQAAGNAVLVLGALHDLHAREPSFGYAALRAAIVKFAPDILVLEVRPDELAERKMTPGRPEYPDVIWPLLDQLGAKAVAMEPAGAMFKEITSQAGGAFKLFSSRTPDGAAALEHLEKAVEASLVAYWQEPAQAQDATTASLAAGLQAVQFGLIGPVFAAAQTRWDGHMAKNAQDAVRAHPGKRVLVLGSYRNRAALAQAVHDVASDRLVDSSLVLRKNALP